MARVVKYAKDFSDYPKQMDFIKRVFTQVLKATPVLVTEENYLEMEKTNKNTWEVDDDNEGLYHARAGTVIIPQEPTYVTLNDRRFQVLDAHCDTDHGWCNWVLGVISMDDRVWHSMDSRLFLSTRK